MASEMSGPVRLWSGWSLVLPGRCIVGRNDDGSWSAWDTARAIDVDIIEVGGTADGTPLSPVQMLGRVATIAGDGWVGDVIVVGEADETGAIHRLVLEAGAINTYLLCSVSFREPSDLRWAETIIGSIEYR